MNDKKNDFSGNLGSYRVVKTEDNSLTLWSEFFDENCHSLSGAKSETEYNYLTPTRVKERSLETQDFTILEVGFGLGTGVNSTLSAVDSIKNANVKIISLELDEGLVKWAILNNSQRFNTMPSLADLEKIELCGVICYQAQTEHGEILVPIGNARETLTKLNKAGIIKNIHAVYQDPFSPKKNPVLWTVEWFQELKEASHPTAILSTYSASSSVKKALYEAGWIPEHRKGFKGKRQSITATLTGEISDDMRDHLNRSPVVPFRD